MSGQAVCPLYFYAPHRNIAMYPLTSNDDIYRRTANCFCKGGIEFGYAVLSMNADDFVGGHSILALEHFMDEC